MAAPLPYRNAHRDQTPRSPVVTRVIWGVCARPRMADGSVAITVFAGISGMDKASLVDKIIKKSGRKDQILDIDFDRALMRALNCEGISTFLDRPSVKSKIDDIEKGFGRIHTMIEERGHDVEHVFLRMHLSYFKNSEILLPPLPQFLSSMLTKVPGSRMNIIVLTDDVFSVWQKLGERAGDTHPGTALKLREVMIWRSAELSYAEVIRHYNDTLPNLPEEQIHSYPVSIRHPFSTFSNLIFEKDPRAVYLSYHITSARNDPQKIREINGFRHRVHALGERTHTAVFDPVAIDELALGTALADAGGRRSTVSVKQEHRWPLGAVVPLADGPPWPIDIPRHEVKEVLAAPRNGKRAPQADVGNQITSRDFQLVELAKYLAVYRPLMGGCVSRGVDAEIKHAVEHGRKVVAYHRRSDRVKDGPSTHPFDNKITVMPTANKLLAYLERIIAQGNA